MNNREQHAKGFSLLLLVATFLICIFTSLSSVSADVVKFKIDIPLKEIVLSSGSKIDTKVGFSGLYHHQSDSSSILYAVPDPGPILKCDEMKEILGKALCEKGNIHLMPDYNLRIYKLRFNANGVEVLEDIAIKDSKGQKITGLSNPLKSTDTEKAYDINGKELPFDANAFDPEAIVKLSDGTFWLGEEYAPGLVHVGSDGTIIERLVPDGLQKDLKGASYPVRGVLPEILKKRKLNRGIEAVAVSPDEKILYFILQSPLANPDSTAYKKSRNVRIFKMDLGTMKILGEYVYILSTADSYPMDKGKKQEDVKVSEMAAVGLDQLIVLERVSKQTLLYKIDLRNATNIFGSVWDKEETIPSLEQKKSEFLAFIGITPVTKELVFNSVGYPELPGKIEGMALFQDKMVLTNDSDFHIGGDDAYFVIIPFQ